MTEQVQMIQYFNEHNYKINVGENNYVYYPSVTTLLNVVDKPFLRKWYGDVGNREASHRLFEASNRGKRIHHAAQAYFDGRPVEYIPWDCPLPDDTTPFYIRYQDEYLDFLKIHEFNKVVKPEIIATEETVFSHTLKTAGTVDLVVAIDSGEYKVNGAKPICLGGLYVIDFKTGNQVSDTHHMQTAVYAKMVEEMADDKLTIDGTIILHTASKTRTGIPGLSTIVREKEQIDTDLHDFLHAAALWHRTNKVNPKLIEFPQRVCIHED